MQGDGIANSFGLQTRVDGQEYNVHCADSSDFVVGRQTNFHAPVTIINCPSSLPEPTDSIVIRDGLWTSSANKQIELEAVKSNLGSNSANNVNSNGTVAGTKKTLDTGKGGTYDCTKESLRIMANKTFLGLPSFIWLLILFVILSCFTWGIVQLSIGKGSENLESSSDDKIYIGNKTHIFFRKKDWGGLNASSKIYINEPAPYVVISHTVSQFCYYPEKCTEIVRGIQKYHFSLTPPFADIAANFLVGGDGNIYEGRGWGVRSPHESFVNNLNIDITFIGDFSGYDVPTPTQVDAVQKLLERAVEDCHVAVNYKLVAHSSIVATLSPGKNILAIISTWDHFVANPKQNITRFADMESACPSTPVPHEPKDKIGSDNDTLSKTFVR